MLHYELILVSNNKIIGQCKQKNDLCYVYISYDEFHYIGSMSTNQLNNILNDYKHMIYVEYI